MIKHLRRAFSSLHLNLLHPEESPEVFNPQKQNLDSFFQNYMKSIQESKQGRIRMKPSIINQMIDHSKSPEDLDAVLTAYYNFLGHKNGLNNILVDQILHLAVRVEAPFKIFHLLEHHRFLGYFPKLEVLEVIVQRISQDHPESVIELSSILSKCDWLPKSKQIYETIFSALRNQTANQAICDLYASIPDPEKLDFAQEIQITIIEAIVADVYREEVLFHYFVENFNGACAEVEEQIKKGKIQLEAAISHRKSIEAEQPAPAEQSEEKAQEENIEQ